MKNWTAPSIEPVRGHSCPMPLGIRTGFGEFLARGFPGTFEFGEIFLECTNGSRLGGAALAPLGKASFADSIQQ